MPNETLTVRSTDNTALFIRKWSPDSSATGLICLVHGLGEHSGRYDHVATAFNKEGFIFYAYDQRGHGKSDGKRGDISSYQQLLDDLQTVLNKITSEHDLPVFLYGHSMGGNVVTSFLMERKHESVRGGLITSPWLTLSFNPPKWQLNFGKLILKVFPGLVQSNKLNPDELSRDKDVGVKYKNDPLVHDKISPRLFFSIHDAGLRALSSTDRLQTPTLIVHGTKDSITSPKSSEALAKGSSNELKLWDGLFHETHNEINKEEVIDYNVNWVKSINNS